MTALPSHAALDRVNAIVSPLPHRSVEATRFALLGHVLGLAGCVLLPLCVFAPLGAAPLLGVAAFLALLIGRRRLLSAWPALTPVTIVLLLLVLLGAASVRWSVVPDASLHLAWQLALTLCAAVLVLAASLVVTPREQHIVRVWLVTGVLCGIAMLAAEWRFDGQILRFLTHRTTTTLLPITRLDRGETVMAILIWPAALAASILIRGRSARSGTARRRASATAGALLVILAFVVASRLVGAAGKVAIGVGALGFLLTCLAPRTLTRLAALLALALVLAMPVTAPLLERATALYGEHIGRVEFSSWQRIGIWYFVRDRVAERPWSGWGLDASRTMPGGHDHATLPSRVELPLGSENLPLHPHNNALQWWLELGAFGALLGGLVMALAIWQSAVRVPCVGVAAAAAVGAVMMVSFGAWQFWWLAAMALTASMVVAVSFPGGVRSPLQRTSAVRLRTLAGRDRF